MARVTKTLTEVEAINLVLRSDFILNPLRARFSTGYFCPLKFIEEATESFSMILKALGTGYQVGVESRKEIKFLMVTNGPRATLIPIDIGNRVFAVGDCKFYSQAAPEELIDATAGAIVDELQKVIGKESIEKASRDDK